MGQRNQTWIITAIALVCLASYGCSAPERYRNISIGMTSDEVLAILGQPDSKTRAEKQTSADKYFGPRPSDAYQALPDGTPVEVWSYDYFRETWSYFFSLEEQPSRVVDTGYHHPDIVY